MSMHKLTAGDGYAYLTLFDLIRTEQIRTIRVGRVRKVPVESLHEFVERQRP